MPTLPKMGITFTCLICIPSQIRLVIIMISELSNSIVRDFVDLKDIPSTELVLLGGDFNEDKDCRSNTCNETEAKCEDQAYYNEMIEILSADTPSYL